MSGAPRFAAEGEQAVEVVVGVFQIGLDDDAEMRPRGEFRIERDPLEEAIGDFVEVPLLEIEVDERAEFLGAKQQRAHALQQPLARRRRDRPDRAGGPWRKV